MRKQETPTQSAPPPHTVFCQINPVLSKFSRAKNVTLAARFKTSDLWSVGQEFLNSSVDTNTSDRTLICSTLTSTCQVESARYPRCTFCFSQSTGLKLIVPILHFPGFPLFSRASVFIGATSKEGSGVNLTKGNPKGERAETEEVVPVMQHRPGIGVSSGPGGDRPWCIHETRLICWEASRSERSCQDVFPASRQAWVQGRKVFDSC